MPLSVLVSLVIYSFLYDPCLSHNNFELTNEYCQWETFNASCPGTDDVIMMLSAYYGRMKFGRCMKEDHGSVGCTADVLSYLDRLCSGRRHCQLIVPDATLHAMHQCPKEVMSYLEASYTCVNVRHGNKHSCAVYGGQPIRADSGYLPIIVSTHGTGVASNSVIGGPGCPWIIQVRKGQAINLTIINFNQQITADRESGTAAGRILMSPLDSNCGIQRLFIQDRNRTSDILLPCGGATRGTFQTQRERTVYVSDAETITVYLQASTHRLSHSHHMYLIKFQAIGCADIQELPYAWTERRDDVTIVKCNFTSETYYLTCDVTRWKGDMSRCSTLQPTKASQTVNVLPHQRHTTASLHSHGLLVVVGLGVALGVAVGVFILFAVVICHRRRKSKRQRMVATDHLLVTGLLAESRDESRGSRASVLYAPNIANDVIKRRTSHYRLAPDFIDIPMCQCCRQNVHQDYTTCHDCSIVTSSPCSRHVVCDGNVDRLPHTMQLSCSDPCELNILEAPSLASIDHVTVRKAVTSFVTFKSPENVQIASVDSDVTASAVEAVDCSPTQQHCSVDLIQHMVVTKD